MKPLTASSAAPAVKTEAKEEAEKPAEKPAIAITNLPPRPMMGIDS